MTPKTLSVAAAAWRAAAIAQAADGLPAGSLIAGPLRGSWPRSRPGSGLDAPAAPPARATPPGLRASADLQAPRRPGRVRPLRDAARLQRRASQPPPRAGTAGGAIPAV